MIITGYNGIYPTQAVQDIVNMLNAPIPIKVSSWYLQQFNIFDLVVMDYNVPQMQGGISQQPIQITFSSSNSAILVIQ
jgi:CheY-like chemotaxis protein